MFSKACEYAIRASVYIAEQSQRGKRVSLEEIAAEIDSPEAFTAKILQRLGKHAVIDSMRGPSGGFLMDEQKSCTVKLSDIVFAIDGNKIYTGCGLGLKECNEDHPCPLHDEFKKVRDDLKCLLESTSVNELAQKLETGLAFLKT